jgi:hypothetical protein
MFLRQYIASIVLSAVLFLLTIRLVQRGRLDIAYCWIWLGISLGAVLVVLRYDWLQWLSRVIGAVTPTTTLFLMGFFVILLMCMQFSLVISQQRRQIKRLSQQLALLEPPRPDGAAEGA